MRALAPILPAVLALLVLSGCSALAGSPAPQIGERTPITPEERSTCEALGRVDLATVGESAPMRERSATALEVAAVRAPPDVGPVMYGLAGSFRRSLDAARKDPGRPVVVAWLNEHCGGSR